MRNILVVVGSGFRGGNTDHLADAFINGARKAGHTVNKVCVGNLPISGCRGCRACQQGGQCVLKDAMQEIYPLFAQCDTIVLASPLYFWSISASVKAFIERLYAVAENDEYPHRDTLLLMTAGDDNFWTFEQPVSYYRFVTKAIGWSDRGMLLVGGCHKENGDRHVPEEALQKAHNMGKSL